MEQDIELSSLVIDSTSAIGITLEPHQVEKFLTYLKQLLLWNQTINLTGISDERGIIIKHFVDSLAALRAESFGQRSHVLDIGTGAGFPGIPLRIVRPDLLLTLVEPAKKKASFLHFLVGLLHLEQVKIFEGTLEQFIENELSGELFDYVTTRALTHDLILRKCSRLLKEKTGKAIFYLTKSLSNIQSGAEFSLVNEYVFELPDGFGQRVISVLAVSKNHH